MLANCHHLLLLLLLLPSLPSLQLGQDEVGVMSLPDGDGEDEGVTANPTHATLPTLVDQIFARDLSTAANLHWNDEIYGRVSSQNFEPAKSEIATDDGGITIDAQPIKNMIYSTLANPASNPINQLSQDTLVSGEHESGITEVPTTTATTTTAPPHTTDTSDTTVTTPAVSDDPTSSEATTPAATTADPATTDPTTPETTTDFTTTEVTADPTTPETTTDSTTTEATSDSTSPETTTDSTTTEASADPPPHLNI